MEEWDTYISLYLHIDPRTLDDEEWLRACKKISFLADNKMIGINGTNQG